MRGLHVAIKALRFKATSTVGVLRRSPVDSLGREQHVDDRYGTHLEDPMLLVTLFSGSELPTTLSRYDSQHVHHFQI